MPSADQIRNSVEVRIEQLESELRQLRAAHDALIAGPQAEVTDGIPGPVLRVFKDWDVWGRLWAPREYWATCAG